MIKKYLIFSYLNKVFFRIFKPINPIDFDGVQSFEHNLIRKIFYSLNEINLFKILNGETFQKILIILKETLITIYIIILYPISYAISFTKFRFLHIYNVTIQTSNLYIIYMIT